MSSSNKKTLKESVEDLKKLKVKQEKTLQIRAAQITQKLIDAFLKRIEQGEK